MSDEKRMDTALLAENDENTAAEENALVMKLDKPFTFEGQTYTEVDLSGLEDTTAADLQAVGRFVTKKNPAANPATVEMTLEYMQCRYARELLRRRQCNYEGTLNLCRNGIRLGDRHRQELQLLV